MPNHPSDSSGNLPCCSHPGETGQVALTATKARCGLLVLVLTLSGCADFPKYHYRFQPVATPDQTDQILVSVTPTEQGFAVVVDNQSDKTAEVIWDRCAYVDTEGLSHRLVHSGIQLLAKEQPQSPTTLAPHSRIEDSLFPSDYVKWGYSDWETRPLFPTDTNTAMGLGGTYLLSFSGMAHPESYRDKEFSVLVTVDEGGKSLERVFRFKVAEVFGEAQAEEYRYFQEVRQRVMQRAAQSQGLHVTPNDAVTVSFTVKRNGEVSNIAIAESSGNTVLEQEAMKIIRDVAPLPPFSKSIKASQRKLVIPLSINSN